MPADNVSENHWFRGLCQTLAFSKPENKSKKQGLRHQKATRASAGWLTGGLALLCHKQCNLSRNKKAVLIKTAY